MRKLISLAVLLLLVAVGCDKGRQAVRRIADFGLSFWRSGRIARGSTGTCLDPIPEEVMDPSRGDDRKGLEAAFCSCFKDRASDYPNVWNAWMRIRSKVRVEDARLNDLYVRYKAMGVNPKTSDDYRSVELDASAWHSRLEEFEQAMKQVYLDDSRFRLTDVPYEALGAAAQQRKRDLLKSAAEISRLFPTR